MVVNIPKKEMESRWHVPAGNIGERTIALHITQDKWSNIKHHLDRNRITQEALETEANKKTAMQELSHAMTKSWDNSVENIRIRTEELRQRRLKEKDDEMFEEYIRLKKNQADEREEYVAKMRDQMAKKTDYPKALDSALLLTEVLYEREKQKELKSVLKQHSDEVEKKYSDKVFREAREEVVENEAKKLATYKRNRAHSEILKQQAKSLKDVERKEKERRIKEELEMYDFGRKEMESIKEHTIRKQKATRAKIKRDIFDCIATKKRYQETLAREDREIGQIVEIIDKAKNEIKCITKQKAEDIELARVAKADKMGNHLMSLVTSQEAEEEKRLQAQIAHLRAIEDARFAADVAKKEALRKETIQTRKDAQQAEEKRLEVERAVETWHMLNRFKTEEQNGVYEEKVKKEEKEKQARFIKGLDEQVAGKRAYEESEAKKEKLFDLNSLNKDAEDKLVLSYAGEVIDYAKSRGRMTYPIEKVISQYKSSMMNQPQKAPPCAHYHHDSSLVNKTAGKMAHDPETDPGYRKSLCKCTCHKDVLMK